MNGSLNGPLYDLDPTVEELAALGEVLAEIDGPDAHYWREDDPPGGSDDYEGPWDDSADGYGLSYELDEAGSAIELAGMDPLEYAELMRVGRTLELARQEQDAENEARAAGPRQRRYSSEERLARALSRIEQGTYTPGLPYRDQADLSNTSAPYGCGQVYDETGRCAARYHQGHCIETTRTAAATGDEEAASYWRGTLLSNTRRAVELSSPDIEELLGPDRGVGDVSTYRAMRELLGLDARQPLHKPVRQAAPITPQQLGIY